MNYLANSIFFKKGGGGMHLSQWERPNQFNIDIIIIVDILFENNIVRFTAL